MILKQYYLACLAHASYLVADETTRVAAVVDPQRDIDQYVQDAERQSLEIRHVFLTHFHADFVAGHLELAQRLEHRFGFSQHTHCEALEPSDPLTPECALRECGELIDDRQHEAFEMLEPFELLIEVLNRWSGRSQRSIPSLPAG